MMKPISFPRWVASTFVLLVCVLLVLHLYGVEAFVVPTGSMAPAVAGHHRAPVCARCGFRVLVGRHGQSDEESETSYDHALCPNCGSSLNLDVPEATGDHILVNKSVFLLRRPRRWEMIVFRLFGKVFIKRVIGLPGEWIVVEDGDVYIDNVLARKTLAELKQVRVLVFDNRFQPNSKGWGQRWEHADQDQTICWLERSGLFLAGLRVPDRYCWLTYRNFSLDTGKVQPLEDEYAYNGGFPRSEQNVHDFMIECDLEVQRGDGRIGLGLTDGQDNLLVELPAAPEEWGRVLALDAFPPTDGRGKVLTQTAYQLKAGKSYHLEMAFADRRLTLRVDGEELFSPLDLPPARNRQPVTRPVSLGVRGVDAAFRNIRLYRDLHYTQGGRQAVRGKAVHLGPDQYFVMGDNSPNSDDSRFWPGEGKVPGSNLIGKPFLVHLPSRAGTGVGFGRRWQYQLPDWSRVRWLR
jgi:signal peptidase I